MFVVDCCNSGMCIYTAGNGGATRQRRPSVCLFICSSVASAVLACMLL